MKKFPAMLFRYLKAACVVSCVAFTRVGAIGEKARQSKV